MCNALELLLSLVSHELHLSALLVAETLDLSNPTIAWAALRSLLALGHQKRIQALASRCPAHLKYHEIAMIYIRSGKQLPAPSVHHLAVPAPSFRIAPSSLCSFFSGLNVKERSRKRFFIQAFKEDWRNIEALAYLAREYLCTPLEIGELVSNSTGPVSPGWEPGGYRAFLAGLFTPKQIDPAATICPLSTLMCTLHLFKRQQYEELFRRAVLAIEHFPESGCSFESMGIYYLAKKVYKEGKKCFEKAIKLNPYSGLGYLGCGVIESMQSETNLALHFLETAYAIMSSSCIPAYCLAYEYQKAGKLIKTKYFYRRCLEHIIGKQKNSMGDARLCDIEYIKRNKVESFADAALIDRDDAEVINRAIYCFIYNEDYEEAMKYIKFFGIRNLLKVFCLLFVGRFDEAKAAIKECEVSGFFHATQGFLMHISDNFEGAAREYGKCIAMERMPVVEELLNMALENISGVARNHAFDYSSSLFDALEYNKRCSLPF